MEYYTFTDLELMTMISNDDRAAYAELYRRYAIALLNHAFNKTKNREEARDIVQEVFAMLWSKRKGITLSSSLSGFLYTAVRNIILNQITHQNVQHKYIESMLHFSGTQSLIADHLIREKQLAELIEIEIANLPRKMREVFELSRKEHLSHAEIAIRLGISEQTVSKHITNALKIFRKRLGVLVYLLMLIK